MSNNVVFLKNPIEVDSIEWGFSHINCDALYLDGKSYKTMRVVAYALNKQGNYELYEYRKLHPELKTFGGVDECMLNFGGAML